MKTSVSLVQALSFARDLHGSSPKATRGNERIA